MFVFCVAMYRRLYVFNNTSYVVTVALEFRLYMDLDILTGPRQNIKVHIQPEFSGYCHGS